MSQRTREADKAIRIAWEREQTLVREGRGTRDWTIKQQEDILVLGKAYDDNGLAFEGQHMKSVERFPEYQGNPDNIQFLTKAEHLEAHGGNWQNPTNWYYDPLSKSKLLFAEDELIPCVSIELSQLTSMLEIIPAVNDTQQVSAATSKAIDSNNSVDIANIALSKSGVSRKKKNIFQKAYEAINRLFYRYPILNTVVDATDQAASDIAETVKESGITSLQDKIEERTLLNRTPNEVIESETSEQLTCEDTNQEVNQSMAINDNSKEGTPKSPHVRHGHPHTYWKLDENGNKVKTIKQLNDIYVNSEAEDYEDG